MRICATIIILRFLVKRGRVRLSTDGAENGLINFRSDIVNLDHDLKFPHVSDNASVDRDDLRTARVRFAQNTPGQPVPTRRRSSLDLMMC